MTEMGRIKEIKQGEEGMKAGREREKKKRKKLYAILSSEGESKKILKTYKN